MRAFFIAPGPPREPHFTPCTPTRTPTPLYFTHPFTPSPLRPYPYPYPRVLQWYGVDEMGPLAHGRATATVALEGLRLRR